MRLPLLSDDQKDIDRAQLEKMVDLFIERGFTYFDTSYIYHAGVSEDALKRAVVDRHPRDTFTIATKFPVFAVQSEDQVDPIFEQQLRNLGTDHVDYYLLHSLTRKLYDGVDGKGGPVKTCRVFEHAARWKAEGRVRNLGFSFHDTAEELDHILDEHPEVDFVQIILNYYDWNSYFIQSEKCYNVIRRHGKKVVVMEPVKGGFLAKLPEEDEKRLRAVRPDWSPSSWALHYAQSHDGVIAVLSGMSDLAQVEDNTSSMREYDVLDGKEKGMLAGVAADLRRAGPEHESDFSRYEKATYHGIPVSDILDAYNSACIQPNPRFSGEMNYLAGRLLALGIADVHHEFPDEKVVVDGEDITGRVKKAWDYLVDTAIAF